MVAILEPTVEHCRNLAPILREMDQLECRAVYPNFDNEQILLSCALGATRGYAVVDEVDGCVAIFGVRDVGNGTAIPWMLASELFFTKYKRRFIREAPGFVQKLFGDNTFLFNYISKDNHVCIRWLASLGFTIDVSKEMTINGVTFHPFYYRKIENV